MDLATLDKPVAELSTVLASDLAALSAALDTQAAVVKRRKETLGAVLSRRFEEQAKAKLVQDGKDTGTVHLEMNGLKLKVEFPKEVEWDQTMLSNVLDSMSAEDARHYAKVTIKVDERKFTAAPPAVKAAFAPCRTVSVGKPKFTFDVIDTEAA